MAYNKKSVLEANTEAIRIVLRLEKERREATEAEKSIFCVVMFGLINVNILYYSFSTLYQMCNLRQSL